MEKDSEIYKGKKERIKSIALKAKKESSDDETSTSGSDDEEYAMAMRNFKNFFRRKHQKAFIGGSSSDSENDAEDKTNDETCLMSQSSNEVTLNSSCYIDNTSSRDNDNMQIEYDILCEISLKIIKKNKILKTKRDLFEKEILELNEKIKKLEKRKEIEMACKSCDELKLENTKLKETLVKFVKFDKSANSLREMLNNQKSPSCKIDLGFNSDKASTSETKTMSFVGSSAEKVTDGSTIKRHGSTLPGSVCLRTCLEPDEWSKDSGCSKHMTGNKSLFSTYKAYDGDSKPTKTPMSTEIKLTKDDEADSVDSSNYRGTKMPSEYQQDYKKTRSYALKLYNDTNMSDSLRDIYRALESRYVYEGRTIDPSFYNDLSDDSVAKFTAVGFNCLLSLDEQICPSHHFNLSIAQFVELTHLPNQGICIYSDAWGLDELKKTLEQIEPYNARLLALDYIQNRQPFNLAYFIVRKMYFFRDRRDKVLPYGMILTRFLKNLKANMAQVSFNERYKLVSRKMSSIKAKQPKRPPPKRTRNLRKSKQTQLTTSSSTKSPPSDNRDFPSTKLSPRSYHRALKDNPNMSKEQRETRGMFKNLGRALHNFARMLKKGCR
nr:retrotransposon protein, putative, unclassified [Tanacetum cinerariifolium]